MTLPPEPDRWTIDLANAQRMEAIAAFGFTERQARFLLQRAAALGRVRRAPVPAASPASSTARRARTSSRRSSSGDSRRRSPRGSSIAGRMFHVHYKPLWAAIGEPDNRFRKPTAQGRMIERVMLLDAVLDDREFIWLGPSMDKRRHFIRHLGDRLELRDYPHLLFGDGPEKTVRYFPDKLPIGMQPHADTHVFVYLVTRPSPMDFRLFLLRHVPLLRVLFRWTVRLLLPRQLVEGQTGLPARRPRAPRDTIAPLGGGDVGVAVPRTEAARRTGRRAGRRTLPQDLQRLPHAAVSSALPTVVGRSPEHALDGRLAYRGRRHRPRARTG